MKLILHIGITKTGTSSIQTFFWKWRELLLNRYEIFYPETGIFFGAGPAHYKFTWFYFKDLENRVRHPQVLHEFKTKYKSSQQLIDELFNELNKLAKPPVVLILSSENYFVLNPQLLAPDLITIINKLSLNKITLLVYFRRQDKWLEATYSQHVKGSHFKKFQEIKSAYLNRRNELYYDKLLSSWRQAFPEAQIIPRIYDRRLFPEGNVILDFLTALGIDMPEAKEQKIEANPSLSVLSTLVLRSINEKFKLSIEEHKEIVKYLIKLDQEEESPIKSFFGLSERIKFLEYFSHSNERLFKEWFRTNNKFLLSEEEIKFYEEQDRISKSEIERMVDLRYKKVLSYMNEKIVKGSR